MPSGRVRFFDPDKGFGFITKDEGDGEVYFRANVLPDGVTSVKRGQRVAFGIVDGRRGEQALSVELIDPPPSLSKATRRKPEDLAAMMEDLIKMLDGLSNGYRRRRYPSSGQASKIAAMLRGVADELEK